MRRFEIGLHNGGLVTSLLLARTVNAIGSWQARNSRDDLHIVYQVPCSAWSLHQAIVLDWSWKRVEQPGSLTRIVCGCSGENEGKMQASVLQGDPRYHVFFAKDWNEEVPRLFPQVSHDKYHAYNHPFAFADWLTQAKPAETYILYMEPDMFFLNPILNHIPGEHPQATPGRPVGQSYSYIHAYGNGADPGWAELATPQVCGPHCTTLLQKTQASSFDNSKFAVGPPTMMHRSDWSRLVGLWSNYSVQMRAYGHQKQNTWQHKGDPPYIAEMLAYSLAAAVTNLPHESVTWAIDGYHTCSQCEPKLIHNCYPLQGNRIDFNKYRPPFAYAVKGMSQWKQNLFMNCEMPLFEEPDYHGIERSVQGAKRFDKDWMALQSILTYNGAFHDFKKARCPEDNFEIRKLVRITEDDWYVPVDAINHATESGRPLSYKTMSALKNFIRSV